MTLVRGFGLVIQSDIAVHGAMTDVAGPAAISVELGSARPWQVVVDDPPYRVASVDRFDFTVPGLARYTCIDRRRIVVDALPGADAAHVSEMLIATALPALCWARGGIVLHAAAAVFPGFEAAVAVAGPSGSGKSTWLAAAVREGARVVADDALHLQNVDGQFMASGLPGGWFRRYGPRDHEREFCPVPPDRQCAAAPLEAITVLDDGPVRKLQGTEGLTALLQFRHRPRIPRLLGLEAGLLADLGMAAQSVAVLRGQPVNQPV